MNLLMLLILSTAHLVNGKCSTCLLLNLRSKVSMNQVGAKTTAMFCGNTTYDENGNIQLPKPCNSVTIQGKCTNGHNIAVTWLTY